METPALPLGDSQLALSLASSPVDIPVAPKPKVKTIERNLQNPSLFSRDSRDLTYRLRLEKSPSVIGSTLLAECKMKS